MKADLIREENNNFLKRVRSHIADKKIPLRLVLTSVDKLDLCGSGDLSGIFLSRHVNIKVDLAKQTFGLNDCQILPVVNYVKGNTQNITQDVLALTAIDSILEEALSYISEQV
uniref:Uncharacterized protein n=2 Tax=Magallana TaxID=2171616 RepID=A0A8W8LW44_MAGGI